MRRLLPRLKALASEKSPFGGKAVGRPGAKGDVHWAKPELVAEIEFAGWSDDEQLRQASFKGLREDKDPTEVEAERPARPESTDLAAPASREGADDRGGSDVSQVPAGDRDYAVFGVVISNPDKVLWPEGADAEAVTKLELARYYEAVGPWMIGHLKGRPCSIVRAPEGIRRELFFQRHAMAGMSRLLSTVIVSGDKKAYIEIDRVEGLVAAAQVAAVELHPWNCAPGKPEVPGRLVFDLDPAPNVDFRAVIAGARELRERLEALELVPFCKTTGGKGIHVVTPLEHSRNGSLSWDDAKAFAREVCLQMAQDDPDHFLITMAKKERAGRIFLDYLRNDRTSTAVAVLSPRGRPGAPVSMPLLWTQLRSGLDPRQFTIRTTPALLAESTAWKDYEDSARPLEAAVARLAKSSAKGKAA